MSGLTDGIDVEYGLASPGWGASRQGSNPQQSLCVECGLCCDHCPCTFGGVFVPGQSGRCRHIDHVERAASVQVTDDVLASPLLDAARPLEIALPSMVSRVVDIADQVDLRLKRIAEGRKVCKVWPGEGMLKCAWPTCGCPSDLQEMRQSAHVEPTASVEATVSGEAETC